MQTTDIFNSNSGFGDFILSKKGLNFWGLFLIGLGFTTTPILLTLGMAVMLISLFFDFNLSKKKIQWIAPFFFYWGLNLLSITYTDDLNSWLEEIKIKLPILIIPFCIALGQTVPIQGIAWTYFGCLFATSAIAFSTLVNYLLNFDAINTTLLHSKAVPIITFVGDYSHIYFSTIMACCTFMGWVLWEQSTNHWKKYLSGAFAVFLIFCLHFFASRTGLLAFYGGVVLIAFESLKRRFNWKLLLLLMCSGLLMAFTAYFFSQGVRNKIANTQQDIAAYQKKSDISHWSIARRLASWELSFKIIKEHPIIGIGPGDIKQKLLSAYDNEQFIIAPEHRLNEPHNQYLSDWLGLGTVGLCVLAWMLVKPLVFAIKTYNLPFLGMISVLIFAAFAESIFERQIGITFWAWLASIAYVNPLSTNSD